MNLFVMKGLYSGKVAGIKLIEGMIFESSDGKIEIKNSANLVSKNVNNKFAKEFAVQILKQIYINNCELFVVSGFVEDSYFSAILSGMISAFVESVYSFLSWKYSGLNLLFDIKPVFDENNFELSLKFIASISVAKTLFAFLKTIFTLKKFKEVENER